MRKHVVLRFVALFLLIISTLLFAQTKTITNITTNDKGVPVASATVNVKGTKTSVITNEGGVYALQTGAASPVLVITSIGFGQLEVSAANGQKITLTTSNSTLNDVVVIGYGTARRTNVSPAISSVNEKDLKNLQVAGIEQALQSKVSGVSITNNSGQPGGGVSIWMRRITSVNGSEPLYVIDGVPILTSTSSTPQNQLGDRRCV